MIVLLALALPPYTPVQTPEYASVYARVEAGEKLVVSYKVPGALQVKAWPDEPGRYYCFKSEDGKMRYEKVNEYVLYTATWCGPCRQYKATWDTLSARANGANTFEVVDIDSQPDRAAQAGITSVPTVTLNGNKIPLPR